MWDLKNLGTGWRARVSAGNRAEVVEGALPAVPGGRGQPDPCEESRGSVVPQGREGGLMSKALLHTRVATSAKLGEYFKIAHRENIECSRPQDVINVWVTNIGGSDDHYSVLVYLDIAVPEHGTATVSEILEGLKRSLLKTVGTLCVMYWRKKEKKKSQEHVTFLKQRAPVDF